MKTAPVFVNARCHSDGRKVNSWVSTLGSNLRLTLKHCVARSRFAAASQLAESPFTVVVSSVHKLSQTQAKMALQLKNSRPMVATRNALNCCYEMIFHNRMVDGGFAKRTQS